MSSYVKQYRIEIWVSSTLDFFMCIWAVLNLCPMKQYYCIDTVHTLSHDYGYLHCDRWGEPIIALVSKVLQTNAVQHASIAFTFEQLLSACWYYALLNSSCFYLICLITDSIAPFDSVKPVDGRGVVLNTAKQIIALFQLYCMCTLPPGKLSQGEPPTDMLSNSDWCCTNIIIFTTGWWWLCCQVFCPCRKFIANTNQ